MNNQEYLKELKKIDAKLEIFNKSLSDEYLNKKKLVNKFRDECKHNTRYLTVDESYETDEFGTHKPNWSMYTYKCTRCGTELYKLPHQLDTVERIQELMFKINKKNVRET